VNVKGVSEGGLGVLGAGQLAWLEGISRRSPRKRRSSSTRVADGRPKWSWGDDGERALALLRRFGSVTVLNGIHQVMQKVEGNIAFPRRRARRFPRPAPGGARTAGGWPRAAHDARLPGVSYIESMPPSPSSTRR
jgi:hypothetical protein